MAMLRVYYDGDFKPNSSIRLDIKASHHVLRVLRIRKGDNLVIFNGNGHEFSAKLVTIDNKQAVVDIITKKTTHTESPLDIELGQAISKGERMDYAIQKSVELGVSKIVPLLSERCNVKLSGKRLENRLTHWRGVVISACEQSGRCRIPELKTPQKLDDWLAKKRQGLKLVCDPSAKKDLSLLTKKTEHVTLLIGPEGGLSNNEIQSAKSAGFEGFYLGPRILRTETATVAALSLVQSYFGDLLGSS